MCRLGIQGIPDGWYVGDEGEVVIPPSYMNIGPLYIAQTGLDRLPPPFHTIYLCLGGPTGQLQIYISF